MLDDGVVELLTFTPKPLGRLLKTEALLIHIWASSMIDAPHWLVVTCEPWSLTAHQSMMVLLVNGMAALPHLGTIRVLASSGDFNGEDASRKPLKYYQ